VNSHELAKILLAGPDLPVATHAMDSDYLSSLKAHGHSHGPLKVGMLESYAGQHVVIGDISRRNLNDENWRISSMSAGDAPEEWDDDTDDF
jgi:hypothetical protein